MKSRVADIVEENGFDIGDRDELIPAAGQSVGDAETIVLRRSRPLQISLDGQQPTHVWTTASTVDEALVQLSMTDTAPAAASRSSRVPLAGMVAAGRQRQDRPDSTTAASSGTVRLAAADVGTLLAAAGAPLAQRDTVVPAASAPVTDGMRIAVTRMRIEKVTRAGAAGAHRRAASRTRR